MMQQEKVKFLKAAILNWGIAVIIFLAWILNGCTHTNKKFHANKEFHQVVTLKKVKVHIISDRSQFDSERARIKRRVNGYARRNNEIWLLGYEDSSGVRVKKRTLGHELMHLLHWKDDKISHPHTY